MNISIQNDESRLPVELQAVLQIFQYDRELQTKALPHVDVNRASINWARIWENDFGGAHAAALTWAQAIWCDQIETRSDPFDRAFAMDLGLRRVVLKSLALRWGFESK